MLIYDKFLISKKNEVNLSCVYHSHYYYYYYIFLTLDSTRPMDGPDPTRPMDGPDLCQLQIKHTHRNVIKYFYQCAK